MQYTTQYLFNQGTGEVKRTVYRFTHDAGQRLVRLAQEGAGYVLYYYEGNRVSRAEEYTASGEYLKEYRYRYAGASQLVQFDTNYRKPHPTHPLETRTTYQYDNRGNLRVLSEFVKNSSGHYEPVLTFHFEDYDKGEHVENLSTIFPYLPAVTFRVNNYGTKIARSPDGKEIDRETFTYTYNRQGKPIRKLRKGVGGTLTASYSY